MKPFLARMGIRRPSRIREAADRQKGDALQEQIITYRRQADDAKAVTQMLGSPGWIIVQHRIQAKSQSEYAKAIGPCSAESKLQSLHVLSGIHVIEEEIGSICAAGKRAEQELAKLEGRAEDAQAERK